MACADAQIMVNATVAKTTADDLANVKIRPRWSRMTRPPCAPGECRLTSMLVASD
jgi:hypothetical protein